MSSTGRSERWRQVIPQGVSPQECMIWTPDGVWLQTTAEGVVRLSGLGLLPVWSVEEFCRRRRIALFIRNGGAEQLQAHGQRVQVEAGSQSKKHAISVIQGKLL